MGGNGRYRAVRAATARVPLPLLFAALAIIPAVGQGQAGPRTDTPRAGTFRFTAEPVTTTWERQFTDSGHEQRLAASLPTAVLIHAEQRITWFGLDFGITNRLAVGVRAPLVRVNTRASFPLDSAGVNPADTAGARRLDSLLTDTTYGFGEITGTSRRLHFFSGDVEVQGKYRIIESHNYALSAALVARLPTGHPDSPNRLFDISSGDGQTDIELQVAQELTLFDRLWLNGLIRVGRQEPGVRARRVGSQGTLLLPHAALATLDWDPGDYAAIDVAPMYRFARSFGVGFTAGYYTQKPDRYTYQSAQDSVDIATRLGAPVSASVLNAGTGSRWTRLGVAMTYQGSDVEGSLSFEQTVSGSALVPVASVFRIVMRISRWPF